LFDFEKNRIQTASISHHQWLSTSLIALGVMARVALASLICRATTLRNDELFQIPVGSMAIAMDLPVPHEETSVRNRSSVCH
jgi:hypothetical protein